MKFYLIGIKGSGMAGLCHILLDDGYEVTGLDVDNYIFTQDNLIKRGVKIHSLNDTSFKDNYFVIVGHAFKDDFLLKQLNKDNIPYLEYHKFLSFYFNKNKLISICGSHGKTTMVGLLSCYDNVSFLRGDGYGKKVNNEKYIFLESCEYQDHFLAYSPKFTIITNIDYDHVDYFLHEEDYINSFRKFAKKVHYGLINYNDSFKINNPYFFTYGLDDRADFYAEDYIFDENGIKGKIYFQTEFIAEFNYHHLFGLPLIEDIVGVVSFYYLMHEDVNKVLNNINKFIMAKNRFNITNKKQYILIEDYAHHPHQLKVNLDNINVMYKDYVHIGIFKPDRISRFIKFKEDFKDVLNQYDLSFILDFNDKKYVEELKSIINNKIIYLHDLKKIQNYLSEDKKYVFSLMSSKNLDDIKRIIEKYFLKLD